MFLPVPYINDAINFDRPFISSNKDLISSIESAVGICCFNDA